MQKEYIPLLEEAKEECKNHFKEKLLAFYLHGSIAFNDAVPYISDLDSYIVISGEPTAGDKEFYGRTEGKLQEKYPIINGVHLNIHSREELKEDSFARFILRYNSVLYYGGDIVKALEENGAKRMLPNLETAKGRLSFARQCFSDAIDGKRPANTGSVPENVYYAARKFARYFVIIEGAYFLMAENRFVSFEKETVLKELRNIAPEFKNISDITEKILQDPIEAMIPAEEYLKIIKPLVEYMFDTIFKLKRLRNFSG